MSIHSFSIGQDVIHNTKQGAGIPSEFRGIHNDPETGALVARIIHRPAEGPPCELSAPLDEISAAVPVVVEAPQVKGALTIDQWARRFVAAKLTGGQMRMLAIVSAMGPVTSSHIAPTFRGIDGYNARPADCDTNGREWNMLLTLRDAGLIRLGNFGWIVTTEA